MRTLIVTLALLAVAIAAQPALGQQADPETRLEELGITLGPPPQPVANYVSSVRSGNLVFLAGHGPRLPEGATSRERSVPKCRWKRVTKPPA